MESIKIKNLSQPTMLYLVIALLSTLHAMYRTNSILRYYITIIVIFFITFIIEILYKQYPTVSWVISAILCSSIILNFSTFIMQ
jgi:hypothetical protein